MKWVDRLLAFLLGAVFAAAALLTTGTWRYGNAPSPETEQLRARIAELEQAMRAAELQRQANIEQRKRAAEARADGDAARLKDAREAFRK